VRPTYHLVPADDWAARDSAAAYAAPSLASEGFIHCTDGPAAMVATANRHYRSDPRPFLVLTLDLDVTGSDWRFDDEAGIYPHIYGTIAPAAILRETPIPRATDGTFLAFAVPEIPDGIRIETIYVVEATYGPDALARRAPVRPEHLARAAALLKAGQLIEAGGFADASGSLFLVPAASEAEALALFRDDVYTRAGVWTGIRARALGRVITE
jgi:uncharacterized protein (DUF952 family)/uncharacterized protein YciI